MKNLIRAYRAVTFDMLMESVPTGLADITDKVRNENPSRLVAKVAFAAPENDVSNLCSTEGEPKSNVICSKQSRSCAPTSVTVKPLQSPTPAKQKPRITPSLEIALTRSCATGKLKPGNSKSRYESSGPNEAMEKTSPVADIASNAVPTGHIPLMKNFTTFCGPLGNGNITQDFPSPWLTGTKAPV